MRVYGKRTLIAPNPFRNLRSFLEYLRTSSDMIVFFTENACPPRIKITPLSHNKANRNKTLKNNCPHKIPQHRKICLTSYAQSVSRRILTHPFDRERGRADEKDLFFTKAVNYKPKPNQNQVGCQSGYTK